MDWIQRPSGTWNFLRGIAYGNGHFVTFVAGGEFFPQSGRFKNGSGFSLVTAERKRPVDLSTGLRCY
jgi:hypothetical protein